MQYLDNVDSEGGPFLIADAEVARAWRGSEEGGADYERACRVFEDTPDLPGSQISIGQGLAIIWDTEGAGTADVFLGKRNYIVIVRAWLDDQDDSDEMETISALAELPMNEAMQIGLLTITSGVLAILWSPESGGCIEDLDVDESERPTGEMATDSSGLLVKIAKGSYSCLHDEIETAGASARRCHLVKQKRLAGA